MFPEHRFLLVLQDYGDAHYALSMNLPALVNDIHSIEAFQMPGTKTLSLMLFHELLSLLGFLLVGLDLVESQNQRKFFLELYD